MRLVHWLFGMNQQHSTNSPVVTFTLCSLSEHTQFCFPAVAVGVQFSERLNIVPWVNSNELRLEILRDQNISVREQGVIYIHQEHKEIFIYSVMEIAASFRYHDTSEFRKVLFF